MTEPVRISPPQEPLSAFGLLRTVVRNPIAAWPQAVYTQPSFRSAFFGRETVFVMDPDLIRTVLVDEAEAFEKGEVVRRALEPLLGDAILTAYGARWRWQRRAVAPIFRHDRLLDFIPAMAGAAERTRQRWLALAPGTEVNVAHEMMRTTFDVIVRTMLSSDPGLDVDRVEQAITHVLEATSWVLAITMLRLPSWTPHPGSRRADRARRYLKQELRRLVLL